MYFNRKSIFDVPRRQRGRLIRDLESDKEFDSHQPDIAIVLTNQPAATFRNFVDLVDRRFVDPDK